MNHRPEITVNEDEYTVTIDGLIVSGWVLDETCEPCERCGERLIYDDHHDAELCAYCNEWDSEACDDPACGHCPGRPKRPLWRKRVE